VVDQSMAHQNEQFYPSHNASIAPSLPTASSTSVSSKDGHHRYTFHPPLILYRQRFVPCHRRICSWLRRIKRKNLRGLKSEPSQRSHKCWRRLCLVAGYSKRLIGERGKLRLSYSSINISLKSFSEKKKDQFHCHSINVINQKKCQEISQTIFRKLEYQGSTLFQMSQQNQTIVIKYNIESQA